MRTQENAKTNYAPKSTSKAQVGPIVRLPVKKMYCSKCQKLVRGQVQGANDATQVMCPKCHQRLWFRGALSWRCTGKDSNLSQ